MKYEAPICEVVRINDEDIIRTSFDTPDIDITFDSDNSKGGNSK